MGVDKFNAIRGNWKNPEKWFSMNSLVGGAFEAIFGMLVFHHKTSKTSFQLLTISTLIIFPVILILRS
ncbi:MAG: DUF1294 domain-containing protein [Thermoproteota archaeon]